MLTCPMHIQLVFRRRLLQASNSLIVAMLASSIGKYGLLAKTHVKLRRQYDMTGLDLSAASSSDLFNVFAARLERFVLQRNDNRV